MPTLERRVLSLSGRPLTLRRKPAKRGRRDDEPAADKRGEPWLCKCGKWNYKAAYGAPCESCKKAGQFADSGDEDNAARTGPDAGTGHDEPDGDEGRDNSPGTIAGYAAVAYNEADPGTEYELWSDRSFRAVERVAAGAFRAAMERPDDCRGLYNHEPDQLLGRTGAGTMRLEEDGQGLRYEIDLPDTQTGRDVAELVDRGDLTGSSFGFVVEQESWRESEEEDGSRLAVRTIESVRLLDVGPVTYPAYASTSAGRSANGVRALGSVEEARASYRRWKEGAADAPLEARLAAIRARAVRVAAGRA